MAILEYKYPIEAVHGKLKGNFGARQCAKNASGVQKNVSTHYGKRSTDFSMDEVAAHNKFGTITKMIAQRLNSATQRVTDKQGFAAQSTYKTMRKYLWHICEAQLNAQD